MKVTDRHRFEFDNASDQCFKAAADECVRNSRQIKYRECDSLERRSPMGSHFTFEGGGDRKITKDNKWSWRMINNTQRTKECIILNSYKVKATTKSLAKRNSEVHWFLSKPKMGSTHFLNKGGRSKSVSLIPRNYLDFTRL